MAVLAGKRVHGRAEMKTKDLELAQAENFCF
jgi:hypothetical protein